MCVPLISEFKDIISGEEIFAREERVFFFSQDGTFNTSEGNSESEYTFRPAFLPCISFPLVKHVLAVSLMLS